MYTYHISVFLFEDGWLMFFVSALTVPLQKREKSGCKDWIKNLNSQKVVDHFWRQTCFRRAENGPTIPEF